MELISITEISLRLFTAAILGAAVGLERERNEWAAGLRTHTVVSIGSALTMIVSIHGFGDVAHVDGIDLDPSRVAAQVVSGIGFIGAGTILFLKQEIVKGLTTAAAIWCVAAIGLAVGGGMYVASIVTTLLILFVLAGIKWAERKFLDRGAVKSLSITMRSRTRTGISLCERIMNDHHIKIMKITVKENEDMTKELLIVFSKFSKRSAILEAIEEIQSLPEVVKTEL
ncbi:MAG TPA: MgtC/SapB family protein [Pedobacter sp.]|nr:MgtC/SapB family protein [Pedobacter sp.]